jgi:PAS domain S-box-containing protein
MEAFTGLTRPPGAEPNWWFSALHPDDFEYAAYVYQKSLRERSIFEIEARLRHVSGHYRYMHMKAVPLLKDDGSFREWVGTLSDITEQKLAEKALLDSEAELRLVSDNVPLLMSHVSSDLKYLFVNQSYADWFGLPREKIVGRHISEILSPRAIKAHNHASQKCCPAKRRLSTCRQRNGQSRALTCIYPAIRRVRSGAVILHDHPRYH